MSENPTLTKYDELNMWRCPQLGGPVNFDYCRCINKQLPCFNLFRCWGNQIDLQTWLDENYTQDEIKQAMDKPENLRLKSMFDVLQTMKKPD